MVTFWLGISHYQLVGLNGPLISTLHLSFCLCGLSCSSRNDLTDSWSCLFEGIRAKHVYFIVLRVFYFPRVDYVIVNRLSTGFRNLLYDTPYYIIRVLNYSPCTQPLHQLNVWCKHYKRFIYETCKINNPFVLNVKNTTSFRTPKTILWLLRILSFNMYGSCSFLFTMLQYNLPSRMFHYISPTNSDPLISLYTFWLSLMSFYLQYYLSTLKYVKNKNLSLVITKYNNMVLNLILLHISL